MSDKRKITIKDIFNRIHRDELDIVHFAMFEYGNLPDTVDPHYIEEFLQTGETNQCIAWWRLTEREATPGFPAGSLVVTRASLGNRLNPYGEGTEVIATTGNGFEKRFYSRYDDEVALGFNNINHSSCTDIINDAATLAEIDISIRYLIFYTRLYPLYKVADERAKEKLLTAFNNMDIGTPLTIIDKPLLEELGIESASITTETITYPDLSRVIQYISKLREDIKRWHFTKYGQTINSSSKLAQETVDEVNGAVSASLIIPLDMLKARRDMIEEVNRKFGTNITVDFSGAWRAEVTRYEDISGEEEIDGTEDPEPEQPEETKEEVNEDDNKDDNSGDSEKSDDNNTV